MTERFVPGIDPPSDMDEAAGWWFAFHGADLLMLDSELGAMLPRETSLPAAYGSLVRRQFLGTINGTPCWSAELASGDAAPDGGAFWNLRDLWGVLDEPFYALAGRAAQIVAWDRDHQFCGRCGAATEPAPGERARRCPLCGLLAYPRLAPAVITLVERDERILLARGKQFASGRFGIIAGFVESGESLEDAVHREIDEETGLVVDNVRYHSSQPWPFPHTIMLGFQADWAGGEIRIDDVEIAEADWFAIDNLPTIPPKMSIARRLIDDWATRQGVVIDQP